MDKPASILPNAPAKVVLIKFTKLSRFMAISRGLILVDVLIGVGAILLAVHIFRLSRGMDSNPVPRSPTNTEHISPDQSEPAAGKPESY